jgi:branched-chain amino acid transport system permease protein
MVGQLIASGLALGSIYALLALSLVLINKAADVVNFAQGEMAMFGTFICFALLTKAQIPLVVVLMLAAPIGALLGIVSCLRRAGAITGFCRSRRADRGRP